MLENQQKIKIFIIAGEPSGDVLGGKLMAEIKQQSDIVEFVGVGGCKMQEQGLQSIFPMDDLSLMGFAEVVPHIPKLLKRINQTVAAIIESKANMVITIDSPDFCFRVIKKLNKNSLAKKIKKVHFIAPTVWAYRENRAQKIAKLYNLLLVILPFEPPYFEKYGLETLFIGHPIVENNPPSISALVDTPAIHDFKQQYNIKSEDLVICAMAGSRVGEVRRILPEIIGAINILAVKNPNLVVLMPVIKKTKQLVESYIKQINTKVILIDEVQKHQAFQASNLAIAKSGTNNLEIAIAGLPMITIYKINPITHFIIAKMVKVKFANIINIILNFELIPELIQDNCNSQKIAQIAQNLIFNSNLAKTQILESQNVLKILGLNSPESSSKKAAKKILSYFSCN
jgi:lipid-A-disaccharide synthase